MTPDESRKRMIRRLLHTDADSVGDDGEDTECEKSVHTNAKHGGGGNTRLPYGLCEEFGIKTEGFSPKDCWDALAEKGITPKAAYKALKKDGNISKYTGSIKKRNSRKRNGKPTGANGNSANRHNNPPRCTATTISGYEEYYEKELGAKCSFNKATDIRIVKAMTDSITDAYGYAPKIRGSINYCGSLKKVRDNKSGDSIRKDMYPVWKHYFDRILPNCSESIRNYSAWKYALESTRKNIYASYLEGLSYSKNFDTDEMAMYGKVSGKYRGIYLEYAEAMSMEELEASLVNEEKNGISPEGCSTVKSMVDHEVAHAIDHAYNLSKNDKIIKYIDSKGRRGIRAGLSGYAADSTNKGVTYYKETIAEAWSEYKNNPNPRPIAQELGRMIEEIINSN